MKKIMRNTSRLFLKFSLLVSIVAFLSLSNSAFSSPWKDSDFISSSVAQFSNSQSAKPQDDSLVYRSLELDEFSLKDSLQINPSARPANSQTNASSENEQKQSHNQLVLPLPDGTEVTVVATETSVLAPELALQFPEIKTWKVAGLGKNISGRIDFTLQGFHAMLIMPEGDTVFIEPDDNKNGQREVSSSARYLSFSKHENHDHFNSDFKCGVTHDSVIDKLVGAKDDAQSSAKKILARPAVNLITYRLAVATTGEYTQFHGSKAVALSAVITTINRVNEIYERDLSIRFELVPQQLDLIYTDPANDPYSNNNINALITQNIANLNNSNVLGPANYDVGHVFGSGNVGGLAFVGSTCNDSFKAGGATGSLNPIGDGFNLDYVAHELGHQLGAQHTFNSANCGERGVGTAVEPGSGSTIMSYAGLCGANNLQNDVDPQFHVVSIEEMLNYSRNGNGNSCGSSTAVTNENPIVSAGDDFTVPARTPIVLIADGFDADGDSLTYSWEQADSGAASDVDVDTGDNALFRSRPLKTSNLRFIPQLSDVFNGIAATGEHLPVTDRDMELRATVRDGKGGVQFDSVTMSVHDTGTAFQVTSHTSSKTYAQGDITTITWDVAGTNARPISCQSVDIGLITLDGSGIDITTTSNDGSEKITIPASLTVLSNARFIVSCASSQFFSVSSANLTILDSMGNGVDDSASSGGGGSVGYLVLLLMPLFLRKIRIKKVKQ